MAAQWPCIPPPMRWVTKDGNSTKEQAVFDNLEDAKAFRMGTIDKRREGNNCPKNTTEGALTFGSLVLKWKPFHFLKLERSTQQTYEKRLPNLDFLKTVAVEEIKTPLVDDLVAYWVTELHWLPVLPLFQPRSWFGRQE